MAYKTVLVHCNDDRRIGRLLVAASAIASTFQSHIVGLSVVPPVSVVTTGALEAPPVIVDAHCELYRRESAEMRKRFTQETARLSAEWRDAEAGPYGVADIVLSQARAADLVIASQTDPDWPLSEWLDVADRLVVESGRPVLILPNGPPRQAGLGRRVLVAWNGRRESARAAFDALPMLAHASATRVVRVTQEDAEPMAPDEDICTALRRHGVKCDKTVEVAAQGGVGATLMAQAKDFDADLMVMGCYGHSRLREFVFGGASRHMLQKMAVPLLMSH